MHLPIEQELYFEQQICERIREVYINIQNTKKFTSHRKKVYIILTCYSPPINSLGAETKLEVLCLLFCCAV